MNIFCKSVPKMNNVLFTIKIFDICQVKTRNVIFCTWTVQDISFSLCGQKQTKTQKKKKKGKKVKTQKIAITLIYLSTLAFYWVCSCR